jgi:O-antigen polysaccharide polymerase Wzy
VPDIPVAPSSATVQAVLVAAIGIVLLAPVVWRAVHRRLDPFEPIVIFAAAYSVMFVLRPAAMIARDERVFVGTVHTIDVSDTFGAMLFLALVGALAFVIGYEIGVGRGTRARTPRASRPIDDQGAVRLALVVAALALASFLVFLATAGGLDTIQAIARGDTGELRQDIKANSTYLWLAWYALIPSALVLLAVGLRRRSAAVLALAGLVSILLLLRAAPTGTRIMLLPFFGAIFVFLYLRKSSRPRLAFIVLLLLVALVGSTALRDIRTRETRGETIAESFKHIVTEPGWVYDPILSGPDTEMAPALAASLSFVPSELSYAYGGTIFGDLVTRPAPRVLWPEKPLPPRERLLSTMLPEDYKDGSLNSEFSVLLYFYWDFGFAGVIVGLLAFGIGCRYLYEQFCANQRALSAQVMYSLSVWLLPIALRDSPTDTLIKVAIIVLPAWLILRLSTEPSPVRAALEKDDGSSRVPG